MDFFRIKITIIICGISLLFACATPPQREPPPRATELAQSQLFPQETFIPQPVGQGISPVPSTTPSQPLIQIDQSGYLPPVETLKDEPSIDFKKLPDEPISLDFEQSDLRTVIEAIAGMVGVNTVIDPAIGDKVTMRMAEGKTLTKEELWALLQLLLKDAGVSMEKIGGVYFFKKTGPSLPGTIRLTPDSSGSSAPEIFQITPLRYISVESAINVLTPLLQPQGRIVNMPNLNVIGIIATPERLERVNRLLTIVDANPFLHRGIRLFRLRNSKANELKAELDKILQVLGGAQPTYQTIALERINSLLVVTPPNSGFDEVALWVNILDESSAESNEQVFIYRVRNLEAKDLAATLTEVFKNEDKKQDEVLPRRIEPEPIQPQSPDQPPRPVTPSLAENTSISAAEIKVSIVADEKTNSLIIRGTPRDYRELLKTIGELDTVSKEVMVNMVIAEVTLNEEHRFGIDWNVLFQNIHSSITTNFGVRGNAQGVVIDYTTNSLTSILNLVASEGDVKVLSRPSILVRNNEEATINVGSEEPIITRINEGNTTVGTQPYRDVQYRNTGINLKVTPRINEDGIINMKIEQEVSQLGPQRPPDNFHSFTSRKVSTSVVVNNNNAIVIGGLIETTNKGTEQGIPVLRKIPILGRYLFSAHSQEDKRVELVLIIIPQIVNPQMDNRSLVQLFRQRMQAVSELFNTSDLYLEGLKGTEPAKKPPMKTQSTQDLMLEDLKNIVPPQRTMPAMTQ